MDEHVLANAEPVGAVPVSALNDVLTYLRDVQPPDGVPWWPPAPGWWAVSGLAIGAAVLLLLLRRKRHRLRRAARRELAALVVNHRRSSDGAVLLAGCSRLVRRIALTRWPRSAVAGLHGEAWLTFLDRTGRTRAFTRGAGRALALDAYRPAPAVDSAALTRAVRRWIEAVT
jgi:hypothetical protein